MINNHLWKAITSYITIFCIYWSGVTLSDPVPYKFQEFPYFETRKNEALFREYVKACEQTPSCCHLEGVEQTSCVRQVIPPPVLTEQPNVLSPLLPQSSHEAKLTVTILCLVSTWLCWVRGQSIVFIITIRVEVLSPASLRQCISPTCYTILYAQDLLEDGEIDLRLNSFKGCFHQQLETRKTY